MRTYISMLRGINVGGQKRVKMEELQELYESLGFGNVQTYVQSGNAIFEGADPNIFKLASKIEEKIKQSLGFDVVVFIRTKDEFRKLVRNTPFAGKDSSKLHVTFLSYKPRTFPIQGINELKDKEEEFSVSRSGKEIYLFCPNGYGKTKLSNNFLERKLNVRATTRNWRTVNALLSMAEK